jgi:hypothetical protein
MIPMSKSSQTIIMVARAAGAAMVHRMKHFDCTSVLPNDMTKSIAKLNWEDLEVGKLLCTGGFLSLIACCIAFPQD